MYKAEGSISIEVDMKVGFGVRFEPFHIHTYFIFEDVRFRASAFWVRMLLGLRDSV